MSCRKTHPLPGEDRCGHAHRLTAQVHLRAAHVVDLTWRSDDERSCRQTDRDTQVRDSKIKDYQHEVWLQRRLHVSLKQDETGRRNPSERKPSVTQRNSVCCERARCGFSCRKEFSVFRGMKVDYHPSLSVTASGVNRNPFNFSSTIKTQSKMSLINTENMM